MPKKKQPRTTWGKVWHFLWYEDSIASWAASILVAFVLIKFILYPLLGLLLGTTFPVVAVVSDSMEHPAAFDDWWSLHEDLYLRFNITKQEFRTYPMRSGFNKGDIIFLLGVSEEKISRGDIIVYWGGKAYPIIHRAVAIHIDEKTGERYFETKGDNNLGQIIEPPYLDERNIRSPGPCPQNPSQECDIILGRAVLRIPFLGWVKIWAVSLLQAIGVPVA